MPNLVFLMETMIDKFALEKARNKCGYKEGVCIGSISLSSGMGLWCKNLNVRVQSFSSYHFAADICDENNTPIW